MLYYGLYFLTRYYFYHLHTNAGPLVVVYDLYYYLNFHLCLATSASWHLINNQSTLQSCGELLPIQTSLLLCQLSSSQLVCFHSLFPVGILFWYLSVFLSSCQVSFLNDDDHLSTPLSHCFSSPCVFMRHSPSWSLQDSLHSVTGIFPHISFLVYDPVGFSSYSSFSLAFLVPLPESCSLFSKHYLFFDQSQLSDYILLLLLINHTYTQQFCY